MPVPRMIRVRQQFEINSLADVVAEVHAQLQRLSLGEQIQPGETVAITAGSRGISRIAEIVKAIVDHVKSLDGVPIIIPAMGSHGGGTVAGQLAVLDGYGITEKYLQAEIRASMETVVVDTIAHNIPVHFDRHAYECDHVIVCNRIKPHTGFAGEIESGLFKMMLIGLGKHNGANIYHRAIADYSFAEIVSKVGESVLKKCNVVCGLAIVENAADEVGLIEAIPPAAMLEREKQLLTLAKQCLPRLPFPQIDLLIIDEIGKNISGTGLDTNVVGRKYNDHAATSNDLARCRRIFVRGLTEQTHGNACGIGLAEFTTQRVVDAIDPETTRINCITSSHPSGGMIPLVYPHDKAAVESALETIGLVPPEQARVVQIADTLHLEEVLVSEAFQEQLARRSDLQPLGEPQEMQFDADGNLRGVR